MTRSTRITHTVATALAAAVAALAIAAGGYDLSWHSIDGGGGVSSAGDLRIDGTIGQPDAGPALAGGDFTLLGGFHVGGAEVVPPPCVGDVDGDRIVGFDDLLAVLSQWGACGACPADLDEDGDVDFDDLLLVLAGWGPCPE